MICWSWNYWPHLCVPRKVEVCSSLTRLYTSTTVAACLTASIVEDTHTHKKKLKIILCPGRPLLLTSRRRPNNPNYTYYHHSKSFPYKKLATDGHFFMRPLGNNNYYRPWRTRWRPLWKSIGSGLWAVLYYKGSVEVNIMRDVTVTVVWFSRLFISKMLSYFISDQSPEASTSNTSLITMPPTTSSLKTHTGHGHHRDRSSEGPHLGSSAPPSAGHHRPRHHSGGYSRRSSTKVNYGGLKALEKLKSPGITTPQPVLTSEVRKSSKYTY